MLAPALAALLVAAPASPAKLPLRPCVVQGIPTRCGRLVVPEDRTKPSGRSVGLRVVVVPAQVKPARPDAFAYLAGGPGQRGDDTDLRGHRDLARRAPAPRHLVGRSARNRRVARALVSRPRGADRDTGPAEEVPRRLLRQARRRSDAVRDRRGDGRPRGGSRLPRLPDAGPVRDVLRRDRGAGLPEAPPAVGSHGRPRRRHADRHPLPRPLQLEPGRARSTCSPRAARPTRAAPAPSRTGASSCPT